MITDRPLLVARDEYGELILRYRDFRAVCLKNDRYPPLYWRYIKAAEELLLQGCSFQIVEETVKDFDFKRMKEVTIYKELIVVALPGTSFLGKCDIKDINGGILAELLNFVYPNVL